MDLRIINSLTIIIPGYFLLKVHASVCDTRMEFARKNASTPFSGTEVPKNSDVPTDISLTLSDVLA